MIRVTWFDSEQQAQDFIAEIDAELGYPNDDFQTFSKVFPEQGGSRFGVLLGTYQGEKIGLITEDHVPLELVSPPFNPYD